MSSIEKKRIAQRGDTGNWVTASGYARKANPGPGNEMGERKKKKEKEKKIPFDSEKKTNAVKKSLKKISKRDVEFVPEAATSAMSFFVTWAMKPTIEKITNPANMLVHELMQHTMMESLRTERQH